MKNKDVFNDTSLEIMKRMKDFGGQATCRQLEEKYGEKSGFYNFGSVALAKRIIKATGCPTLQKDNKNAKYWPVLYVGKRAEKDDLGCYIWKLRDELSSALDKIDLSHIPLYANEEKEFDNEIFYTKDDFLNEVFMSEQKYDALVALILNKKNIILQGAPGVGKTFTARRLAYSIMKEKNDDRIEIIQFHQNYSYEDFMIGYKPVENGFELKSGIFYRFCYKAAQNEDKDYFFIIDEINRGNLSKIFGELLMLIEKGYRGEKYKIKLAYNNLSFYVPENLYIIGIMNTSDRSLAIIDYALRRRFSFFNMEPGFDSQGFIQYQEKLNNDIFNTLISKIKELNNEIIKDKSLGNGFCIGHSYFCDKNLCTKDDLIGVVEYDIIPMLSEYWFDEQNKLQRWENILRGVFQ